MSEKMMLDYLVDVVGVKLNEVVDCVCVVGYEVVVCVLDSLFDMVFEKVKVGVDCVKVGIYNVEVYVSYDEGYCEVIDGDGY